MKEGMMFQQVKLALNIVEKVFLLNIFVVLVIIVSFGNLWSGEIIEGIVAIVNEEVITLSEWHNFLSPSLERYEQLYEGEEKEKQIAELRRDSLDTLINDRLLFQEAKRQGFDVAGERVIEAMEKIKKRFKTEENFLTALTAQGLNERWLKKQLREQLMVRDLIESNIRGRVRISGEEMEGYYHQNKEDFKEKEQVSLSQILITADKEGDKTKTRQMAETVLRRLEDGENFATLAREFSDATSAANGGELGFLALEELSPEIRKEVSKLAVGEISDIIEIKEEFHILRLNGKKTARVKEFDEVKEEIRNLLFQQEADTELTRLVNDLRGKAYIEIKPLSGLDMNKLE